MLSQEKKRVGRAKEERKEGMEGGRKEGRKEERKGEREGRKERKKFSPFNEYLLKVSLC